jgi:hypothetical protein
VQCCGVLHGIDAKGCSALYCHNSVLCHAVECGALPSVLHHAWQLNANRPLGALHSKTYASHDYCFLITGCPMLWSRWSQLLHVGNNACWHSIWLLLGFKLIWLSQLQGAAQV